MADPDLLSDRELYELTGHDDRRFSPFCWRARLALMHKGLHARIIPCRYADKERIAFAGADTYPVLRDGETAVHDSWRIACYLEDTYPDAPSLFQGPAPRALLAAATVWFDEAVMLALLPLLLPDVHEVVHPDDRAYFTASREQLLGKTLAELAAERGEAALAAWRERLAPLRSALGDQPYFGGPAPMYSDYLFVSLFQWARVVSPWRMLADGDPLHAWRERMLDCFGGLLRATPAFEA